MAMRSMTMRSNRSDPESVFAVRKDRPMTWKRRGKKWMVVLAAVLCSATAMPTAVFAVNASTSIDLQDAEIYEETAAPMFAADRAKIETFVTRLYRYFLDREPEADGLNAWCDVLEFGTGTGAQVVVGFAHSKEFTALEMTDNDYISCLYRIILGREPDNHGLLAWLSVLEQGYSRDKVLEGFVNSQEMKAICDDMGVTPGSFKSKDQGMQIRNFVTRLYRLCLGREPDSQGLDYWSSSLQFGKINGYSAVMGFFTSEEMAGRELTVEQYVTICYRTILDRDPDIGGLQTWINKLYSDGPLGVLCGICMSQEFGNLCDKYGISAFSSNINSDLSYYLGKSFLAFHKDFGWMTMVHEYGDGKKEYTDGRLTVFCDANDWITMIDIHAKCDYAIERIEYGDSMASARKRLHQLCGDPVETDEYYEYYLTNSETIVGISTLSDVIEEVFTYRPN